MTRAVLLRLSELYHPTLKEDPSDAEIASHRLLVRAGFMRKAASGVYTFLPLGKRVLAKIEQIVREEMDAIGAQEILMSALQPAELWFESGRWNDYGPELMRLNDRHDHQFCLGPTHEELITALVRNELRSYKELPVSLYQIQVKFRDEIRPRFGLLRSREFIMKDAYSFNESLESLEKTYAEMSRAYAIICDRLSLAWRAVDADSGQIGGKVSTEFMALADAGEASLVYCDCGFSANVEAAECISRPVCYEADFQKLSTPGIHTISELADFLNIGANACVKALSGKTDAGEVKVLFVPGDHELNEVKAQHALGGFTLLDDAEMQSLGLFKGSMGPVGLPEGVGIVADHCLADLPCWVVGANEEGFHYVGARPGTHFEVEAWLDLCTAVAGDVCPGCSRPLKGARGIEVSQVFQLGTKYSEMMGATFMDEQGREKPFVMGCYGVGISRSLAAVVEQHHDEGGMIWPPNLAPAQICVISLSSKDDCVSAAAQKLASDLYRRGFEVAFDDRNERPGSKFADADLIGWPLQIIVGKRKLGESLVELKHRASGARKDFPLDRVADTLSDVFFADEAAYNSGQDLFAPLFNC